MHVAVVPTYQLPSYIFFYSLSHFSFPYSSFFAEEKSYSHAAAPHVAYLKFPSMSLELHLPLAHHWLLLAMSPLARVSWINVSMLVESKLKRYFHCPSRPSSYPSLHDRGACTHHCHPLPPAPSLFHTPATTYITSWYRPVQHLACPPAPGPLCWPWCLQSQCQSWSGQWSRCLAQGRRWLPSPACVACSVAGHGEVPP